MNEIVPRYEFRVFAQSLGMVAETMRQLSPCQQIEESSEAYLVSTDLHGHKLINEFFQPQAGICVASVFKRRLRFTVAQCAAEFGEALINGAAIQSVVIELEDGSAVAGERDMLGMNNRELMNYPLAIQRVVGLRRLPDDAWYGFSG